MSGPLASYLSAHPERKGYAFYRGLREKLAGGELGKDVRGAFSGLSLAIEARCATKMAVADEEADETDDDARKRRLGELLRRRQPTGLATGSATPHPPRETS